MSSQEPYVARNPAHPFDYEVTEHGSLFVFDAKSRDVVDAASVLPNESSTLICKMQRMGALFAVNLYTYIP